LDQRGLPVRRTLLNCVSLAIGTAIASPLLAQTGSLVVHVRDTDDRSSLAGATVVLSSTQRLVATTAERTDADGQVMFPVLRAGPGYVVEVTMPGFTPARATDQQIAVGRTTRVEIELTRSHTEVVRVTATESLVELGETGGSSKFDKTFVDDLPVPGRFYQNMLTLAPGVHDSDEDGNPNVHGARERNFRATVGGVSNVDPLTGEWLSRINSESIEVLEILPWGAGVEHGRASGGFARILQKQGSNEFEGVFSLLYSSSVFDGAGSEDVPKRLEPDFQSFQPALQLSGPIVKDRAWYRVSLESIQREDPIVALGPVVVSERDQQMNAVQLTWQTSPRNKLALQFQNDPLTVTNYGVSSRLPAESARTLDRGGSTLTLIWTAPYSARLLFDTRLAYQDYSTTWTPQSVTGDSDNGCAIFDETFRSLDKAPCFNTDNGRYGGPHPVTDDSRIQRTTLSTQATTYIPHFLGGAHQLKGGLIVENERFYRDYIRRPDIIFRSEQEPFPFALWDRVGISEVRAAVPFQSVARATGVNTGLYLEDQYKPSESLSVTLGIRLDREQIDSKGQQNLDPAAEARRFREATDLGISGWRAITETFTAFPDLHEFVRNLADSLETPVSTIPLGPGAVASGNWFNERRLDDISIRNDNVSPRLAIAWDPWSNGKTRLSLSAGRYYDKIVLAVPLLELEPPETVLQFTSLRWVFDNPQKRYYDVGLEGAFNATVDVQMVDRDLRTPYQDELSLSFEREVASETSVRLTFLTRRFEDQLQDVDVNHVTGDKGYCLEDAAYFGAPIVVSSPGTGVLRDPVTGEDYMDTDPGNGDGRIDDCTGSVITYGGLFDTRHEEIRDGLPDLYTLNPGWGQMLLVTNANTTEYEAAIFELVRRMFRSWQMNASYTWSTARGDAEDFAQVLGNERTLAEDERGFLDYDQRHVVSITGTGIAAAGWRVGGTLRWESGIPFSEIAAIQTVFGRAPEYTSFSDLSLATRFRYPTRQRNDQRNPSYWTLDLRVAKDIVISRRVQLQLSVEIFNALDDQTVVLEDRINGTSAGIRRFGRRWQIGGKILF
jgi:hypothetical protein